MQIVAEAANGREALQQYRKHKPDVTLMDLQMPELSGLDATSAIRAESPEARIIALTTYAGDAQALRALKAGARAYLLKSSLRRELLDTIRAVHEARSRSQRKFLFSSPNTRPRRPSRHLRSMCCALLPKVRRTRRSRVAYR
jgi:DNA-binding NarL/FixJ family response regulator